MSDTAQPVSVKKLSRVIIVCTLLVVLTVGVVGAFIWRSSQKTNSKDAAALSAKIISKVGKHYVLPGETPTVAQIQDKSSLGDQEFYQAAENGDYVLVYKTSKLAILYREQIDKLIKVSPVVTGPQQGVTSSN